MTNQKPAVKKEEVKVKANTKKQEEKVSFSGYDKSIFIKFKVPVSKKNLENYTPVLLRKNKKSS